MRGTLGFMSGPARVPCPSAMGVSLSHSVVYVEKAQSLGVKVMTRVYTMDRLTPLLREETLPRDERRTNISRQCRPRHAGA
jgi:hypothetical protein